VAKSRLFDEQSLRRIIGNLYADNQLDFKFLLWLLRVTYLQIMIYSPAEFIDALKMILDLTGRDKLAEVLDKIPVKKAGEGGADDNLQD